MYYGGRNGGHLDHREVQRRDPLAAAELDAGAGGELSDAVKAAREDANGLEVERKKVGEQLLAFLFKG